MGVFEKGIYDIRTEDGRLKHSGLFSNADAILEYVKENCEPGKYRVWRILPENESESWGMVIHHVDGHVTLDLSPFPE
jgi:hypothetical protein